MKLGSSTISNLKLGSSAVAKVMLGSTQVWAPAGGSSTLLDGLLAWLSLDENTGTNAADSSGNGKNGTLTNGATWRAGKVGASAASFDGTNDYIAIPETLTEGAASTNAITVAMWIYPDTITSSTTDEDTILYTEQVIVRLQSSNDMECYIYDETGDANNLNADNVWTTGAWQMFMLTFDNTTMRIYRNNVEIASSAAFSGQGIGLDAVSVPQAAIGANYAAGAPAEFFDGGIDEFAVWNRALTADERAEYYNSGTGISYSDL